MRPRRRALRSVIVRALLIGWLVLLPACRAQTGPGTDDRPPPRADPFGRGINLGNALEAPREGDWGLTIQERHLDAIADAGFRTVRLPVKWSAHAAATAPYALDPGILARVDEVVGWALARGLQVIVNVHHYDEMAVDPAAHVDRWSAIWRQVAERFRDAPDAVAFELMNEPHGALGDDLWNAMVREALAIVRATNPTRWVVVGPTSWNAIGALPGLVLPDDPRLALTVHFYDPFDFTHQGAEWVQPAPPTGRAWTGRALVPTPPWQDWSWDTERVYGDELTVTYLAGWAGLYLQAASAATGYERLALRTDRALDLRVVCGALDGVAAAVRTVAGEDVWLDLRECGGGAGVPRIILQNGTDRAQPAFVLERLELVGPGAALPLFVSEADAIGAAFDVVRAWADAHGALPVYVGEFGAYGRADMASRVRWTRAVREAAEERGFGWGYWEFGAGFGAYDPVAEAWRPELLAALLGD